MYAVVKHVNIEVTLLVNIKDQGKLTLTSSLIVFIMTANTSPSWENAKVIAYWQSS